MRQSSQPLYSNVYHDGLIHSHGVGVHYNGYVHNAVHGVYPHPYSSYYDFQPLKQIDTLRPADLYNPASHVII